MQAKKSDKVTVHFIGRLNDGTVIDSTYPDPDDNECQDDSCGHNHGPLELVLGDEDFFSPLEEAVVGMQVGEKKIFVIPAADAFGEYIEENVFTIKRSELPAEITPKVGMELDVQGSDDESYVVTITGIEGDTLTIDSNHPLAGQDLNYEIELLSIA